MTADSKTNYDTETKNSKFEKKNRNCGKQNFEDEANKKVPQNLAFVDSALSHSLSSQ